MLYNTSFNVFLIIANTHERRMNYPYPKGKDYPSPETLLEIFGVV